MTDREPAGRVFHSARREARRVFLVWLLALIWSISICYVRGYEHDEASWAVRVGWAEPGLRTPETLFGLPDWICLGIVLPWLLCSAFTAGFCLGMSDDDLGDEPEGAAHGH